MLQRMDKYLIPTSIATLAGIGLDMSENVLSAAWPTAPHYVYVLLFLTGLALTFVPFPVWAIWRWVLPALGLRKVDTTDNKGLIKSWLRLSQEILDTVTEDDRRDPTLRDLDKDWETRTGRMMEHYTDAKATYERRFSGRVESAIAEMTEKGLITDKDHWTFGHATNPISRKEAASKIESVARGYARKCGIDTEEL